MSYERRKIRVGKVVSDRMDKSVVVAVEWRQPHRLYRKSVKKLTKFKAHDSENYCKMGDLVRIIETRPLSKTKRWQVVEVLSREEIAEIQPEEITVDEDVLMAIPEHPDEVAAPASVEDVEEGSAAVSDVAQEHLGEAEAEAPMAVNDEEEASAAVSDVAQEHLGEAEAEAPMAVNDEEEASAAVSDVAQEHLGEAEAEAPMAVNDEEEASAAVSDVAQEHLGEAEAEAPMAVSDEEEAPAAAAGHSPVPAADDVPGSSDSESEANEGRVSGV